MVNLATHVNNNTQNGKHVDIAITYQGSDVYFAICSVMGATTLAIMAASLSKPRTDRIFFYITASITMVATIAYFAMGSNLGWTPIDVEWLRTWAPVSGVNREIFYVRYIDW
jgi:bacteriorhodopsin